MSNGSANRFSLMRGPSGWGLAAVLGNREGDRMGNLLFWLGIGAAQKGAGSKPIKRRHWQRSHDQRHRPGGRRAKHQESQNCIRVNHDIIKMKQALVGPRLVDQPEPYGLGTRKR